MAGRKAEGGKWAVQVERTSQVTSIFMGVPEQKVAGLSSPPNDLLPEGLYGYQHLLSKPFSGSPAEHLSLWVLR